MMRRLAGDLRRLVDGRDRPVFREYATAVQLRGRKMRIEHVEHLTRDAVALTLADVMGAPFAFVPGEFATLVVRVAGVDHRRAYSICSAQGERGTVRIGLKRVTEPLLKALLRAVIQDEARHVHYGVIALRDHVRDELNESERNEREDWAFEVALLMRNRFLAYEVYDEWFAGTSVSRQTWRTLVSRAPGMQRFRHTMFQRLVPNIREIGLLSNRIRPHYDRAGLAEYFGGLSADLLSEADMLTSSDARPADDAA